MPWPTWGGKPSLPMATLVTIAQMSGPVTAENLPTMPYKP